MEKLHTNWLPILIRTRTINISVNTIPESVDKKNQLDVTFCIL